MCWKWESSVATWLYYVMQLNFFCLGLTNFCPVFLGEGGKLLIFFRFSRVFFSHPRSFLTLGVALIKDWVGRPSVSLCWHSSSLQFLQFAELYNSLSFVASVDRMWNCMNRLSPEITLIFIFQAEPVFFFLSICNCIKVVHRG